MKRFKILVLYYTQTGQLEQILDSLSAPLQEVADITYGIIQPEKNFPFPWKTYDFFNAMPECVLQEAIPVQIKGYDDWKDAQFDLVILGYQPWFLHPSQPTTGFLKSPMAEVLRDKKIITVIGSRNMWLNAQECIKAHLQNLGAHHVGNILFQDRHDNLTSLLTVIRWSFKGQKEASGLLPAAGVSAEDIKGAAQFAPLIRSALESDNFITLQSQLVAKDAVVMVPGLVVLEKKGIKQFRYWAKFIREKGGPNSEERKSRVKLFSRLLISGIFMLTPISVLKAKLSLKKTNSKLQAEVDYFKSVQYEPGKI